MEQKIKVEKESEIVNVGNARFVFEICDFTAISEETFAICKVTYMLPCMEEGYRNVLHPLLRMGRKKELLSEEMNDNWGELYIMTTTDGDKKIYYRYRDKYIKTKNIAKSIDDEIRLFNKEMRKINSIISKYEEEKQKILNTF